MAIEKILNTRISLKVDTLENWGKSTLPLKKGEVAFATVAAAAGTGLTEPVVMMKIGEDGVKTFKDIEWNFYAKASDVLTACKSEDALKTFINGVIADAGIATNDAMEALAGRVTTVEGEITTLKGDVSTEGSVAKAIKDAIDALDLANTYEAKGEATKVQGELNTYKESNDIALANVKATAEAAYVKPVTGIAKSDLAADVQASLGKADTALQEHQDISHLAVKTDVNAELAKKVDNTTYITKVGELETAIGGKVDKIEGKSLISDSEITRLASVHNYDDTTVKADIAKKADSATVTTELGKKVDKVEGYSLVSDTEIERLGTLKNYDDTAIAGRIKTIEDDYLKAADKYDDTALAGRVTELETASATHALKTEVEGVQSNVDTLEAYVGTFAVSEGVDTVVKYIDAKTANIASDETVSALGERVTAAEGAIDAIEADYLKAADKTELEGKITANANAIELLTNGVSAEEVDGVNDLIQYVKDHGTEVTGIKADIKANTDAIAEHEELAAETYETKEDAGKKLTEAKEHATGLNTAMDVRVGVLEIAKESHGDIVTHNASEFALATDLNGYYTKEAADAEFTNATKVDNQIDAKITALDLANIYQAKGDYATAEQGGKADSALQEITTTENGGLKVTNKNQIDIDENIVFIFDCGDSSVTA